MNDKSHFINAIGVYENHRVLLYPTAGTAVDSAYVLQDRRVRIRTLDLAKSWHQITADLLALITSS
jgi:hypothetical protein